MSDIKQQIADGARPLAKVGDVIEHGEAIPANVVRLSDAQSDVLDPPTAFWIRGAPGQYAWRGHAESRWLLTDSDSEWFPMTVVEVDPEPQPAERQCVIEEPHGWHSWSASSTTYRCPGFTGRAGVPQPTDVDDALYLARKSRDEMRNRLEAITGWLIRDGHAEPGTPLTSITGPVHALSEKYRTKQTAAGPVVLSLPQVPDGAVALVGGTGSRYVRDPLSKDRWRLEVAGNVQGLPVIEVFRFEGSVTVEFAPPREPRTWPKLDPPAADVLRVRGASGAIWTRPGTDGGAWNNEDHSKVRSWGALALEDGPLTEVPL